MNQPDIGWCPTCRRAVVELPQGTCSNCFEHTMQLMSRYDHERICAEKDAAHAEEVNNLKDWARQLGATLVNKDEQLSAANALIAEKDKFVESRYWEGHAHGRQENINERIFAEKQLAEKLLPLQLSNRLLQNSLNSELKDVVNLQRQVAMLVKALMYVSNHVVFDNDEELQVIVSDAINSAEATAEAYDREHAEKVLESVDLLLHTLPNTVDGYEVGLVKVKYLNGTLIEGPLWLTSDETSELLGLRAANKKEN